ncbi:hypothetical protein [Variovorax paradoxus]|uniref:hypothetical protein n=1 Tax=Variovorax paradoxus TaxID=34073 RepID=UPI001A93BA01|nr:hypothetical protein [Variovorax paradoxus]
MLNQVIHNATITLQLPLDMSADAEIAALRSAGIPVDGLGNATSGYLFVRTTGRGDHVVNTFRWFATSLGKAPAGSAQNPQPPVHAEAGASAW